MTGRPFADAMPVYVQAGWSCVMPVPLDKAPPPDGFTGAAGRDTDPETLVRWTGTHPTHSVALRMPDGVLGIDVDQYEKAGVQKQGASTLAELEDRLGRLPATWTSTARGADQPSRIHFFRVPHGRYRTKFPDVEIVQRHHRYAVVWPSPHRDAADVYRWYTPDGSVAADGVVPKPSELPELPASWLAVLREGAAEESAEAAPIEAGEVFLAALLTDERPACADLASAVLTAQAELAKTDAGSRHDVAIARVHHLVQLAAAGHPGLAHAMADLNAMWDALTAGEGRGEEWRRMFVTSARKAVTAVGPHPVVNDPCLLIGAIPIHAPAPADDRPGEVDPEPIEPPRQLHPLEVIGAHLFNPRGLLDQPLAEQVLERTYPVLRFAQDANVWLLRGPETWAPRRDLAEWAVALLAGLMPPGDPAAEKGSDAAEQAVRRTKFMSASPSGAVAKKIRALVAGGIHPCSLRITELDREPWLLWAGGIPWDLRASLDGPVAAHIDPATPHLHSAAVMPETRPTPLWDAFTAAVWPDPGLRAWALRVLSIALTGYSDKALPILIGDRDRGKTQVVTLIMSVLGTYAHAADPRLLGGVDNAHASIVYALMGRRLSFIDEGPRDGRIGQERLKQLTGGGELTGNQMQANPVTFKPTHTLVLTTNDEPLLTDSAVRARARLIPCEGDPAEVIAARARIGHVHDYGWRSEAPGVLAALMAQAGAWLLDRHSGTTSAAPEAYRYRSEEIAFEQSNVDNWINDSTEAWPDGERSRALYEAFVAWCRAGNVPAGMILSETKWGRELTVRGHAPWHTRNGKVRPLRLRQLGNWGQAPVTGSPAGPVLLQHNPEALPVDEPVDGDGLPPLGDGLVTGSESNPSRPELQQFTGVLEPISMGVTGVTGLNDPYAHTHAHAPAHAREGETTRQRVTPVTPTHSGAVTERLHAGKRAAAVSHILGDPTDTGELGQPGQHSEPVETGEDAGGQPRDLELEELAERLHAGVTGISAPDLLPGMSMREQYIELKRQQTLRLEAAVRGHLTDTAGRDSEEVQRYFGEGEFEGSHTELRLTWTRFLEQRRPAQLYVKAQDAAWAAGARLGRKHAATTPADPDADYDQAVRRHDPETFAAGYAAGITEHANTIAEAGGQLIDLPAVVTRDGTVRAIALDAIPELLTAFGATTDLTVDVEHSGYPVGHPDYQLRTIQLGNEQLAVVYDAADPHQAAQARDVLAGAAILRAHSATADLVPLHEAGVILDIEEAWTRMHDTVIPTLLADPASTGSDADGLKELARDVLGSAAVSPAAEAQRAALFKAGKWLTNTKPVTPIERSGWAQVDKRSTTMVRYAASDVLDAHALGHALPPVPDALLERERTAQRMTARVASRGLRIDGDHVDALFPIHVDARDAAAQQMRAFGIDNPGSDQQVAAALTKLGAPLPHTKTGRASVAKGAIDPLANAPGHVGELARARLQYQQHDTVLTLFLEPYRILVRHGDGRARPTVYTLGADTGRMSCVRPNLQQVPRQGGVRACITADPGTLLVSADFASVEIRVAAALSGDRNLRAMLEQGIDLHWEIARQVYGPDATKADRYNVKRGVFGRLYGGGIPTLARQVAITETEAAAMVDTLDAMTPELAAWSRHMRDAVKNGHTKFPAYSGRTIHLPSAFPHKAPNYCLTPDTLILRADLQHVPASEIRQGDRLVAFDEFPADGGANKYHRMRTAVTEKVSRVRKASVTVGTEDGKTTTCSIDHLWLVRPRNLPHRGPRIVWRKAEHLEPGDQLLSLGTWQTPQSRTAGYLAGLYDGEGSMQSRGEGHRASGLHFSQLPGTVMDAFRAGMTELGLPGAFRPRSPNSTTPCDLVHVTGLRRMMHVLGTLQPARFQPRFEGLYEGAAITAGLTKPVTVLSVVDAGTRELMSIQTSTRTLVANGYLSHNCIQGTARELLIDTLIRWQATPWATATLLPVHDELVMVIPEAEAQAASDALVAAMSSDLFGIAIRGEASEPSYAWQDAA